MREMLVATREEADADGVSHQFDYSVLIDQMTVNGGFACESYGAKISGGADGDVSAIPNITTSASRIDELMELLTRNLVTPTGLGDVVADWL